jgi:cytochrome c553
MLEKRVSTAIGSTSVRQASFGLVSGRAGARSEPGSKRALRGNAWFLASAAFGLLLMSGCDYKVPVEHTEVDGKELFELCVQCHGAAGQGQHQFSAPSIAGLPDWYITAQLKKFRSGARGAHPGDVTGMMMRPMTKLFHNERELTAVAAYVAALPMVAPAPEMSGGDAARGKTLFAPCSACHGPDAAGMQQVKAPPLNHASDWYLLAQLKKFKEGIRGGTPVDIEGMQMRPMATTLPDEQAMKDVVAHIATLRR